MAEDPDVTFLNSIAMLNFYSVLDDLRAGIAASDRKTALKKLGLSSVDMLKAGLFVHTAGDALGKVDCDTLNELRTFLGMGTHLGESDTVKLATALSEATYQTRQYFEKKGRDLEDPQVYEMYKGLARLVALTVHSYVRDLYRVDSELAKDFRDRVIATLTRFGCTQSLRPIPLPEQKRWWRWPTKGRNAP